MVTSKELRSAAWAAHGSGDLTTAEQLYRQLLASDADAQDAVNLGALLRTQGRIREASEHYHRWLERFPGNLSLRLNGLNCLLDGGDFHTCQRWLEEGLQHFPNHPQLLHNLAKTLIGLEQRPQARALLEQLCQTTPDALGLWLDLGVCCHGGGDRPAALAAFEQAQRVDPADPRPPANCVTLLKEMGHLERAHALLDGLPEALRRHRDVRGARAGLLITEARMPEAAQELEALCEEHPDDPVHWLNLAATLRSLKTPVACTRALKRGLSLHPHHADMEQALGQSLAEMGRQEAAIGLLLRSAGNPDTLPDSHLFNLQFMGAGYGLLSSERCQEMARGWEARKRAEGVGPLWADVLREPLRDRPLRVGYLCADFCNHPVGRFLLPVLRHHNRDAVQVWGLSCGPHDDAIKQELKDACDHWLDLRFGSDLEMARLVADQGLDVLVELGGFTANSRLALLAHRPAPIQLSYLGYYAPTYLEAVDGWIGDAALFATLNACDRAAHQPLLVEGGYMAFVPEQLPDLTAPEPGRRFRFGSFNHSRKLTATTIALWCQVLNAVPEADLVLKSISFVEPAERERVAALFATAGLAPERLVILPWVEGWIHHMACYSAVDVGLDPMPYGGATTSCEALAMGVPLVSLAGPGMVGCLTASVLRYGAEGRGLAETKEAYVAQAKAMSQATPRNLEQRQAVREALLNSPLGDGARLSRELERLYRELASSVERV